MSEIELENNRMMSFIADISKGAKSPVARALIWKEYKRCYRSPRAEASLVTRFRHVVSHRISDAEEYDLDTRAKMLFVSSTPVNNRLLIKLRNQAEVQLDQYQRIIRYKSVNGEEFSGYHRFPGLVKLNFDNLSNGSIDKNLTVNEEDSRMMNFLAELSAKATTPLSRHSIWSLYGKITNSSRTFYSLADRFRFVLDKTIHTLTQFDVELRAKMIFVSGTPVNDSFLETLQDFFEVEVDSSKRITRFESPTIKFSGSYTRPQFTKTAEDKIEIERRRKISASWKIIDQEHDYCKNSANSRVWGGRGRSGIVRKRTLSKHPLWKQIDEEHNYAQLTSSHKKPRIATEHSDSIDDVLEHYLIEFEKAKSEEAEAYQYYIEDEINEETFHNLSESEVVEIPRNSETETENDQNCDPSRSIVPENVHDIPDDLYLADFTMNETRYESAFTGQPEESKDLALFLMLLRNFIFSIDSPLLSDIQAEVKFMLKNHKEAKIEMNEMTLALKVILVMLRKEKAMAPDNRCGETMNFNDLILLIRNIVLTMDSPQLSTLLGEIQCLEGSQLNEKKIRIEAIRNSLQIALNIISP